MKVKTGGIEKRRSGTSKSSGKPYDFTTIYCSRPASDVIGEKNEDITFNHHSSLVFPDIAIGDILSVSFDRKGYLDEISIIEKADKAPQGGNLKISNN